MTVFAFMMYDICVCCCPFSSPFNAIFYVENVFDVFLTDKKPGRNLEHICYDIISICSLNGMNN